jgi:hypothetical protein
MKARCALLLVMCMAGGLLAAEKRYSRIEAIAQLQAAAARAEVIMVGKVEMRRGKRVLVCVEPIRASKGRPVAGESVALNAALPENREGIVFMATYPMEAFSGEIRWLRDGKMNECPELSLAEIKELLKAKGGGPERRTFNIEH